MNRNESFLVYGMFALLALIVLVALLFGGDPAAAMGDGKTSGDASPLDVSSLGQGAPEGSSLGDPEGDASGVRQLDELPGMDPSRGLGHVEEPAGDDSNGSSVVSRAGDVPSDVKLSGSAGSAGAAAHELAGGSPSPGGESSSVPDGTGLAETNPSGVGGPGRPSDTVANAGDVVPAGDGSGGVFGPSVGGARSLSRSVSAIPRTTRVGNYREVTVARGDTFSTLVVRWCGSLDAMDVAAALNETVNLESLRPGTKILLPWVEDDVLAEKQRDRKARSVLSDVAAGKTYTVRSGDSLWVIARRQVQSGREVPGYIQKILQANPTVDADRLQVGAKLVMP